MLTRFSLLFFLTILVSTPASAVVGGKAAGVDDAPWMAALIDTALSIESACLASGGSETFCRHYCGAVLIAPSWALTAGHCLVDKQAGMDAPNVKLLIDNVDLNTASPTLVGVAEVITRSEWEDNLATTYNHDIALLRLDSPSEAAPASLMSPEMLDALEAIASTINDPVHVFGWGRLKDGGNFPSKLQRVAIDLQPAGCTSPFFIPETMICAGELTPSAIEPDDDGDSTPFDPDGEGACERDSGGPLIQFDDRGQPLVAGIVSWGQNGLCGAIDSPTVYSRVPRYIEWVETSTAAAGDKLVDLGLQVTGQRTTSATSEQFIVTLGNNSIVNTVTGARMTLRPFGVGSLTLGATDAGLSCVEDDDGYVCSVANTLMPGDGLNATFTLSGLDLDNQNLVVIEADSEQSDYRLANNEVRHWVARTDKPSMRLIIDGLVLETSGRNGRMSLFLTVINESDHVTAEDVLLTINIPSNHVLFDDGGLDCDLSAMTCALGDFVPGQQRTLPRIELRTPNASDGALIVALTTEDGIFPDFIDEEIRPRKGRDYSYNVTDTPPPVFDQVRYGSGVGGSSLLVLSFLFGILIVRRRRQSSMGLQ